MNKIEININMGLIYEAFCAAIEIDSDELINIESLPGAVNDACRSVGETTSDMNYGFHQALTIRIVEMLDKKGKLEKDAKYHEFKKLKEDLNREACNQGMH